MPKKIEVYECSDGFLTKSLGVYKRREKVLKKYKRLEKDSSAWLQRVGKETDLAEAELSDEAYKSKIAYEKRQALYNLWRKSKPEYICQKCEGSGRYWWTDVGYGTDRDYQEDCDVCQRTGITELAEKIYRTGKWLKEAKKLGKENVNNK